MALKYIDEFRDPDLAKKLTAAIRDTAQNPVRLMEVCGTHTMSIFRYGIPSLLPETVTLLSGPGCPVCVTAQKDIDAFVALSRMDDVIVTTFGDLIKVPGSGSSLGQEKAAGADIRIVYSIFDAVAIAGRNPDKTVVFCAVGFETTIPTIAAGVLMAREQNLDNFMIYPATKLTPPALAALMETDNVRIDGFILPGHVSVITGTNAYRDTFEKYSIPCAIAGFEPIDILAAVLALVRQNECGKPALENLYPRAVSDQGNEKAKEIMARVFETGQITWRGIGPIPDSGMVLRKEYDRFNAGLRLNLDLPEVPEPRGCQCGKILMGLKRPDQCGLFRTKCTPMTPVGPCMVSSEGTCAAFYKYQ